MVAFGFFIPVKIAKVLHIQPNFPYSMMGEVLQTRRLQKRSMTQSGSRIQTLCLCYRWAGSDFVGRFGLFQTANAV